MFTSLSAFGVVSVLDFSHSNRCVEVVMSNRCVMSHCCFNLYFPDDIDTEHLFICLFAICASSLVRYLLRSLVHLLIGLFVYLLLSFKSSLYILDNSYLSDMSFANIFSQFVACLLILLMDLFLLFVFSSFSHLVLPVIIPTIFD